MDMAVTQLIQESCFLSPERPRHDACRTKALEILSFYDATDAAIPLHPPEVEALETRFGVAEVPVAKLLAQFNEDAES